MGRIKDKFDELKSENRKALITFITAGDPDLKTTVKLVVEMARRGADIIELGVPYSDPVAEGPVIQKANMRALRNNIRIADLMNTVAEIRKHIDNPLLYLLYYNCILQYGPERFFKDCVNSGIDGLIIPDLPFEERPELDSRIEPYPMDIISLVSPTSKERVKKIAGNAKGFLYCVSSKGVTGMRKEFDTDFDEFFSYINTCTNVPKAIGFGISTPEHIRQLKRYCDGLIVGSALVKLIGESGSAEEAVKKTGGFVATLREALDE